MGIISLCGIFGWNVGFVGAYFAKGLRYIFGIGAIVASVVIMLVGFQYIVRHCGFVYSARFFGLAALFASLLTVYHHFTVVPGAEILPDSLPGGGGLLGGALLLVVRKFFGVDGGIIILGGGLLGAILLSTTWSLARGILKTKEKAARGASVAGAALSVTYDKVAEVGERVEEHVVEAVKEHVVEPVKEQVRQARQRNAPYNQDEDERFREGPCAVQTMQEGHPEVPETDGGRVPTMPSEGFFGSTSVVSTEQDKHAPVPTMPAKGFFSRAFSAPEVPEPIGTVPPAERRDSGLGAGGPVLRADAFRSRETEPSFPIAYSNERKEAADDFGEPEDMEPDLSLPPFGEEPVTVPAADLAEGREAVPDEAPRPYELPQITHILSKRAKKKNVALEMEIEDNARTLAKTLEDFHVKANIINACHGPAVTRYELEPAPGVKVSKITNLADDLALSLAAFSVRIEPIPGKSAIGIEVPNKELEGVQLREVLEHEAFSSAKSKLTVGLGMDIGGQAIFADLAKMPHLLVAGATGSGKSVCVNTLITSILFKAKPDEVKFILIDPKMVELSNYNGIPHLMVPVVTDAKKAASVLNWAVQEMEKRYAKFAENTVRNMETYNNKFPEDKMFAIVIIIDELADLMMVAPHDVEDAICRLAQKARAAGIHLVLATQRPSVDVITGIIKANIPSRISFAVSSQIDSRTILDSSGAEKLLGKGDMLFYPVGASKPLRVQGAFVSDEEVEMLLDFIRSQGQEAEANEEIISFTEQAMAEEESGKGKKGKEEKEAPKVDDLLEEAVDLVMATGQASASNVQRRFRVGYTRAARLIDTMEQLGIVGPSMGSKPREIFMNSEDAMAAVHRAQAS
ncbi:MAG: DNA translocase FtsK 4TM domain-containing protein [Selenomonadaceae bacterium]|nr:DNA translocase FtsK 4TM domain-containing protein [Selenomonadaceae bacterium]